MSRRLARAVASIAAAATAAALVATGCGDGDSLVGGDCAAGYTLCGARCVDLSVNANNCGACGNVCSAEAACVNGVCQGLVGEAGGNDSGGDGLVTDSAAEGGLDASDGSLVDVAVADGLSGDTGVDGAIPDGVSGDGSMLDGPVQDGRLGDGPMGDGPMGDGSMGTGDATLGTGDSGAGDATLADGGDASADGGSSDGEASSQNDAEPGCDAAGTYNTTRACGDCVTTCGGPTSVCLPNGLGGFACGCLNSLKYCPLIPACVDTQNDPHNCGGCGIFCASQICVNAICVGKVPGGIVFIGHDFALSNPGTQSSEARTLTNAVFIPQANPLRVLTYTEYADPVAMQNIRSILTAFAATSGRLVVFDETSSTADVQARLAAPTNYDVLLVPEQVSALPAGTMETIGASWAPELAAFTNASGVVVVLDGDLGVAEMPQFVNATGLLNIASETHVPQATIFSVVGPGDVEGQGLISPYEAPNSSSVLVTTSEPNGGSVVYVVTTTDDAGVSSPVVIHKAFR